MPISDKKFDLQLYDGDLLPGMQNRDLLLLNFSTSRHLKLVQMHGLKYEQSINALFFIILK